MPFGCGNAHISRFFFRFDLHFSSNTICILSNTICIPHTIRVFTVQHSMNAWFIVLKMHMYNVYRYRSTYLYVLPTTKIQTHLYALRAPCRTTTKPNETFSGARTKDFWKIKRHTSVWRWKAEPGDEDGKNVQRMEKCNCNSVYTKKIHCIHIIAGPNIFSRIQKKGQVQKGCSKFTFLSKRHAYR